MNGAFVAILFLFRRPSTATWLSALPIVFGEAGVNGASARSAVAEASWRFEHIGPVTAQILYQWKKRGRF